ncbi:MAG: hypothetical protein KAH18_07700 [Psychromonas sp.]|nr:hypothetical protein [Psychromonas sp.]
MKTNYLLAILFALTTIPSSSFASIEVTDNLLFSAFGSTSITQSDNKTPLFMNRNITDETCYDCDSTLGLQLDYNFLDNFSTSIQVIKAPENDFSDPRIEWLYVGYSYKQFSTKIGRLRLPIFLDSEYAYVGNAYDLARPPQEVYNSVLGVTYFDGINFTWEQELNDDISLTVVPFLAFSGKPKATIGDSNYHFELHKLLGTAIDLNGINYRIHFASAYANVDTKVENKNVPINFPTTNSSIYVYSLGGEYNLNDLLLKAEVFANNTNTLNWYSQVAYNYNIFTPYISYGKQKAQSKSHSITTGIRFDVTPNISINTEYQYTKVDEYSKTFTTPMGPMPAFMGAGMFTKPFVAGEKEDANVYTLMFNFIL